jgi:NitT/TauT family transport system substrate-binding protein
MKRVIGFVTALVAGIVLSSGAAGAAELVKWRHGLVQAKGDAGFFYMAIEKGFFKRHGLDVKYIDLRGDKHVIRALLAGELDSAEPSPGVTLNAIQQGADIRFIGSTMIGFPYALYVKKSINTWQELKGKVFGVSAPGSAPHIFARVMLEKKGVDPSSIKIANAGGSAGRIQALAGGKIDATASSTEFVPEIGKLGIKVLGYSKDLAPEYPRFTLIAQQSTIEKKRAHLIDFLAAYMEGLEYALNHREETIALTAKINKDSVDNPRFSYIFDEVKQNHYIDYTSRIPVSNIKWLQDQMIKVGAQQKKLDIDKYVDQSLRTEALKRAKITKPAG